MSVCVKSVLDVDVQKHTFTAQLEISAFWLVPTAEVNQYKCFYTDYKPDVVVTNHATEGDTENLFRDVVVKRTDLRANSGEGLSARITEMSVSVERTMELQQGYSLSTFPFDIQALEIRLESRPMQIYGRTFQSELCHPDIWVPTRQSAGNYVASNADMIGDYDIEDLLCFRLVRPNTDIVDTYSVNVIVVRSPNSIMWNVIFPGWLLMALSVSAFWVDPCSLEGRASITLTLLLTQAASMQYVHDQLPPVPTLTPVEGQLLSGTIMLFFQVFFQMFTKARCLSEAANRLFGVNWGINSFDAFMGDDDAPEQEYAWRARRMDAFGIFVSCLVLSLCVAYFVCTWLTRRLFLAHFTTTHRRAQALLSDLSHRKDLDNSVLQELSEMLRHTASRVKIQDESLRSSMRTRIGRGVFTWTRHCFHRCLDKIFEKSWERILYTFFGFSTYAPTTAHHNRWQEHRKAIGTTGQDKRAEELLSLIQTLRIDSFMELEDLRRGGSAYSNSQFNDADHGNSRERYESLCLPTEETGFALSSRKLGEKNDGETPWLKDKQCRTALVFDCGTGATKAIVCQVNGLGEVTMWEPAGCELKYSVLDVARDSAQGKKDPDIFHAILATVEMKSAPSLETSSEEGFCANAHSRENMKRFLGRQGIHSTADLQRLLTDPSFKAAALSQAPEVSLETWMFLEDTLRRYVGLGRLRDLVEWMESVEKKLKAGQLTTKKGEPITSRGDVSVVIGLTAWYRRLHGSPLQAPLKSVFQSVEDQSSWRVERLTQLDECWYEMRSVLHAWKAWSRLARIDAPVPVFQSTVVPTTPRVLTRVSSVLGCGAGSTQYTAPNPWEPPFDCILMPENPQKLQPAHDSSETQGQKPSAGTRKTLRRTPFMLHMGHREGIDLIAEAFGRTKEKTGVNFVAKRMEELPPGNAHETLERALQKWTAHCTSRICKWRDGECIRRLDDGDLVVAISACYYGFRAAALDKSMAAESPTQPFYVGEVVRMFKQQVRGMVEAFKGTDRELKDLANLTYITALLSELMSAHTQIRFARDWNISRTAQSKPVPFRTTWSTGWFLDNQA